MRLFVSLIATVLLLVSATAAPLESMPHLLPVRYFIWVLHLMMGPDQVP